ncbi:hypothetical protein AYO20_09007 [Fonsecaea nubica]|uniref:Uncharacterized protein n=1 Tax=Fonsecaea nubica TaxID=856822 RepID=A0A178CKE5_9EURO|nr:hypothetical protein AYO20_09007 [Fonsecaea nubica]OAL29814.1 hypothetical protein AYO20_09007 [Fonsecaea nubica]
MAPTIEPFNPPCTRNHIDNRKPSQELDGGFFRAYQAIIEDAFLLEQGESNRPQEFVQLVVVVTEILQWASSKPGNETAVQKLRDIIQSKPLTEEEKQCVPGIPADDCLCLLVRLLARKKQPATLEEYLNELQKLKIHETMKKEKPTNNSKDDSEDDSKDDSEDNSEDDSKDNSKEDSKDDSEDDSEDNISQQNHPAVYGIPNHISICIGPRRQTSSNMTVSWHIIATNGEHDETDLGKWAKKSRKMRFQNLRSNVPSCVKEAGKWLATILKDDDKDVKTAEEIRLGRLYEIESWKLMSTAAKPGEIRVNGPRHFCHMTEVATTFRIGGGTGITRDPRCMLCRMLFSSRQDLVGLKMENDFSKGLQSLEKKAINGNNTCSEGLLHELCEMAERMAAKTQPGTTGTTDQDPDSGEAL